jgi:hypothetical protein
MASIRRTRSNEDGMQVRASMSFAHLPAFLLQAAAQVSLAVCDSGLMYTALWTALVQLCTGR